ncbi:phage tail tape measure protein [Comamonas testosteroni]|uniref:phage tail tape measure protein n=1 Tax=Comamonas TaxID=283 RepID=UPI0006B9DEDC|nr:phage tail tape measure protein [Comamonas testosteroni]
MANELLVGVKIGAVLSGSFHAAFGSARSTLDRVGQVADRLGTKHQQLGATMAAAMAKPVSNIGALRSQYDRLGQTMDQLRRKQDQLTASIARGDQLKNQRKELRSDAMETVGTAIAVGAPVLKSVKVAADFQDSLRDTAITGEFSKAEEAKLGSTIRASALQWNQTQMEISKGMGVLVAGGLQDAKALEAYAPILAKSATATRASMDDLGSVVLALRNNLKVGEEGIEGSLNMLAYAGKRGQFEIRDMAKWLPTLTPTYASMGVSGKEAVAEIGASLQIARKGAGSNDEAANNYRNFLQKLFSQDTKKDFEKAGVNIEASMKNLRAKGFTPLEGMLEVIGQYMGKKSPEAAKEFEKALKIKDDKERETALQRISEAYKLGELFQDMQAMNFIRPAIENMQEMKSIKQGALDSEDKDLIGQDYKRRTETATEQFKAFKIQMTEIGITIGEALLPPLTEMLGTIRPVIASFGAWAKEHPGLIKGAIGLAGGLLLGKLGFIGLRYGLNLIFSPFNAFKTLITGTHAKWLMLRGLWQAGTFAPAVAGLKTVGSGFLTAGRYALLFGRGLAMSVIMPVKLLGQGLWMLTRYLGGGLITGVRTLFQWGSVLGRMLGGVLLGGLRLAGQAVMVLGRALLLNPIGLFVTAIGVAAYLVYKNWDKVKAALQAGYKWMVGLKDEFFNAGANLINGLVNGVTSKISAARDSIVGFGQDIKGWFTSTLGIKSPSRVFMGFGDNIAQGAAIGIERSAGLAGKAVGGLARSAQEGWNSPQMALAQSVTQSYQQATPAQLGVGAGQGFAGGGMTVQFSPTYQLAPGTPEAVKTQMQESAQMSMHELEKMMRRLLAEQNRRSY